MLTTSSIQTLRDLTMKVRKIALPRPSSSLLGFTPTWIVLDKKGAPERIVNRLWYEHRCRIQKLPMSIEEIKSQWQGTNL